MKILKIYTETQIEHTVFDEILLLNGTWSKNTTKVYLDEIRQLQYNSNKYAFFIEESKDGEHTLFRNKL